MSWPRGTTPTLTAVEFEARYLHSSRVTFAELHGYGRRVYRCYCEDESCDGWAMLSDEIAADELERGRVEGPIVIGWSNLDGP